MSRHTVIHLGALALLFLPFCNKAFHLDDIGFMSVAKVYSWNPLSLSQPKSHWVYESTHSFFFPYFYKIMDALFGGNVIAWHLLFLVFPIIALFSLRSLQRQLFPLPPAQETVLLVLFLAMPAFLVNGQNLMSDVPALAFILLSMASYCHALEKGARAPAYLGGVSLCVAIFISYQAAVFVPVLFLYALARKRLSPHFLFSLSLGPLLLLSWLIGIYLLHDIFPFLKTKNPATIATEVKNSLPASAVQGKLIFILAMTGASTFLIILLRWLTTRRGYLAAGAWLILALLSFGFLRGHLDGYGMAALLLLAALVAFGLAALTYALLRCLADLRNEETRPRALFLLGWIGVVLFYNLMLLPFGSARYLLPALPPLMMLLFHGLDLSSSTNRVATAGIVLLALAFGLSSALSDYRFAETYRSMAAEVKKFKEGREKEFDVWYVGDWGMRYYMEQAGAKRLSAKSNEPKRGDLVIIPEMPRFSVPGPQVQQRWATKGFRDFRSDFPLRLFNRNSQAGFYSHYAGLLPFTWSSEPDESFAILEILR